MDEQPGLYNDGGGSLSLGEERGFSVSRDKSANGFLDGPSPSSIDGDLILELTNLRPVMHD